VASIATAYATSAWIATPIYTTPQDANPPAAADAQE